MNYKQLIISALTPLGYPVMFGNYTGNQKLYITFFRYNRQGELFAENTEITTEHFIQVDLWKLQSSTDTMDLSDLEVQVETALTAAGFQGFTAQDLYEPDIKTNHIAIRTNYYVDKEM